MAIRAALRTADFLCSESARRRGAIASRYHLRSDGAHSDRDRGFRRRSAELCRSDSAKSRAQRALHRRRAHGLRLSGDGSGEHRCRWANHDRLRVAQFVDRSATVGRARDEPADRVAQCSASHQRSSLPKNHRHAQRIRHAYRLRVGRRPAAEATLSADRGGCRWRERARGVAVALALDVAELVA